MSFATGARPGWIAWPGRLATWAGLLLLLPATGAALLAETFWLFDLASHFRPHMLAGAGLLLVLALVLRLRLAALLAGGLAILHLAAVWPFLSAPAVAATPDEAGTRFRLATANVQWSNRDHAAVLDWVRQTEPDILVLQEATRSWQDALVELGEMYQYVAPFDWKNGTPLHIFSRWPIIEAASRVPARGFFNYLTARIEIEGQEVTVLAAHAPLPRNASLSRTRNLYIREMAAIAAASDGPVILAGDFNITPWSPHYAPLEDDGGLRNVAAGRGWLPTWPTWLPVGGLAIDHILVSEALAAGALTRAPALGSDHWFLSVDLVLSAAP